METTLEFKKRPTGTYVADHGNNQYIVFRKNYGYEWFSVDTTEPPKASRSVGQVFNDQMDCCGTTVEDTLDSMCETVATYNNTYKWKIVS